MSAFRLPAARFSREAALVPSSGRLLEGSSSLPTSSSWLGYVRFAGQTPPPLPKTYGPDVERYEALLQEKLKAKVPDFKLDPFQKDAMQYLADGSSVMVSAPTSSGKTLVANFQIERFLNPEFWPDGKTPPERHRVFYTTPRKALSNEKFRDLVAEYGSDKVGLMTGDITLNPEAPIILMTTEVLRNMLYQEPAKLNNVGSVVFDECHFVNDRERGPVWEESMIHMPDTVQQVHLSATVGNAQQYVDWMNTLSTKKTELVYEDKRPVKLEYLVYNPHTRSIQKAFNGNNTGPTKAFTEAFSPPEEGGNTEGKKKAKKDRHKGRQQQGEQQRTRGYDPVDLDHAMARYFHQKQQSLFPAVTTMFSKRLASQSFDDMSAVALSRASRKHHKVDRDEWQRRQKVQSLIKEAEKIDPHLSQLNPELVDSMLNYGFATHHAGMTYAERALVEKALKAGLLSQVWGTDTIGAGINVPERTAVISQFTKYDGEDFDWITPSDFHQIAGRAGRRGMFPVGYVVLVPPNKVEADTASRVLALVKAKPDKLLSKFAPTPSMVLNLLKTHTQAEAKQVMTKSFAAFQSNSGKTLEKDFDATLAYLTEQGLLERKPEGVRLTALGQDLAGIPDQSFVALMSLFKPVMAKFALKAQGQTIPPELRMNPLASIDQMRESELVELVATTLNEKGLQENYNPSGGYSPLFQEIAPKFIEAVHQAQPSAAKANVTNQQAINFTFTPHIAHWLETGDWPGVRQAVEGSTDGKGKSLYIGDFMNITRRTANVLQILGDMKLMSPELRAKLMSARDKLLQPPLAESIAP